MVYRGIHDCFYFMFAYKTVGTLSNNSVLKAKKKKKNIKFIRIFSAQKIEVYSIIPFSFVIL